MSAPSRARTATMLGASAALLLVALWAAREPEPQPSAARWPSPAELDSLSRYLAPAQPAPRVDEYTAFLPALPSPPRAEDLPFAAVPVEPLVERRLSAILLVGDRPLAIIDDQQVRPGDRLDGGAEVISIEHDRVVIREPSGVRRTLTLPTSEEAL